MRNHGMKLPAFSALAMLLTVIAHGAEIDTNSAVTIIPPVIVQTNFYYANWGGWELKPLQKARQQAELIYRSDFSPAGLGRWWLADGVVAESRDNGVVISLAPEAAAAGEKWGVLWSKLPVFAPFAVEVEFTLDQACPHDANLLWGQDVPSKKELGREQECYLAEYFCLGGKACGIERASDWQTFGITGALDPKPGVKRTAVWIVDGRLQCMYLDGTLVLYTMTRENPPVSGYFGLGVFMSKVAYHSVKVFKLNPLKKEVISKLALKPTPPVGLPAVLPAHIAARSAAGGRTALQAGHPSQGGELTGFGSNRL